MGDRSVLRLFVGAYPPREVAEGLLELVRELPIEGAAYRPTPVGQIHLTLQFIGETPARELGEVIESVERSASGLAAFALRAEELATLPRARPGGPPRRGEAPRLIAAMTDAPPTLVELHRRLAGRLAKRPRKDGADRFTPHMTLARFAPAAQGVGPLAVPITGDAVQPFSISRIALMRSDLRPTGAVHEAMEWFDLNGPEGTPAGG